MLAAVFKCVVIGDGMVGKTSMLYSYTENKIPKDYIPTVFDNHMKHLFFQGRPYGLQLWDTAGQEDYDRLRPLSYPQTDIFLVCFSIEKPDSYENVKTKWVPELRAHDRRVPIILVGTKSDLRAQQRYGELFQSHSMLGTPLPASSGKQKILISPKKGIKMAKKIRADMYIECSALTQQNLSTVFESALKICLKRQNFDRKYRSLSDSRKENRPISVLSTHSDQSSKCNIL